MMDTRTPRSMPTVLLSLPSSLRLLFLFPDLLGFFSKLFGLFQIAQFLGNLSGSFEHLQLFEGVYDFNAEAHDCTGGSSNTVLLVPPFNAVPSSDGLVLHPATRRFCAANRIVPHLTSHVRRATGNIFRALPYLRACGYAIINGLRVPADLRRVVPPFANLVDYSLTWNAAILAILPYLSESSLRVITISR